MIDTVGARVRGRRSPRSGRRAQRCAEGARPRDPGVFGAEGVSDDVPLAVFYAGLHTLRIADGPDEVHLRDIARLELRDHPVDVEVK